MIHTWRLLLVKGFYFYEKIEDLISYATKKKKKVHKNAQRRWGGEGRNNYSNATVSYELKHWHEEPRQMLRLW